MEKRWKLHSSFEPLVIIMILLSTSLLLVHSRHTKRVQYGAPCNSTVKCDIHSLLTCEDNICVCLYQDAMSYSSELGTCLSLVNEVCGYLETKRVFINCISQANCDQQQGVCKCTQGFIELERVCVQQKGYGEPCHSNAECKTDLALTCFEEICQCDPEKYIPVPVELQSGPQTAGAADARGLSTSKKSSSSSTEMKCVTRAGLACTAKSGCVPKATCVTETADGVVEAVSQVYSWNHSGICKCDEGYEMDKSHGICKGKFGSSCDVLANVTCLDKFRCLNGVCDCMYPDDQLYREGSEQCVSLVGGPCSGPESESNEDSNKETPSAVPISCDKFLSCKNEVCGCNSGFVENSERGCDLSYGQPCTGETMSKCDKAAGLHCVEGKCSCRDDRKTYDSSAGRCLGKSGSSCKLVIPTEKEYTSSSVEAKLYRKASRGKHKGKLSSECVQGTECLVSREQLRGSISRGTCGVSNKEYLSSNESSD